MGSCPDWYATIRAAKYLGVGPWELLDQPAVWTEWALAAQRAENDADRKAQERSARRARGRR